jgi:DNA mismatch repair protein MutL
MKRKKIKKILNPDKIAAGEVIERPANIVKELIENSIDAGSNEIKIIVKKAGKVYVQIIDDGIGIPSDELELAFQRHTSSKIRSINDLEQLHTLGFRGEALASIAAISKVNIISRAEKEALGTQLIIEGGKILEKKQISAPIGTNIIVKNLFYNVPARKKFLKSDATELGHISDIIQRYALCYPELHFIYSHNDLILLNCPAHNNLKTTTFHIYGKNTAKYMAEISYQEQDYLFKVYGLLGHPKIAKKGRSNSSIFLNNRYIKSNLLIDAISEAYKGILMINRMPFFIIHIELDPSVIDFNVHPKKLEIRFEDENFIYNKIYHIIRNFLEDSFIKDEEKYLETDLQNYVSSQISNMKASDKEKNEEYISSENVEYKLNQKDAIPELDNEAQIDLNSVQLNLEENIIKNQKAKISDTFLRKKYLIAENFPKIRLISYTGQLSNNIYIVLEGINEDNEQGLFILDQHAASERINKEFLYDIYRTSKKMKQKLISPLKIEVSPSEKSYLEENLDKIKKLGFNFESFGGNTFILREIPTIFNKAINIESIKDIISDITEIGRDKSFSEVEEQIINYLACHRSIRGGDDLSLKDIRKLLTKLSQCKDPFHCAHGRPTIRFISFKELDKLFKRTG